MPNLPSVFVELKANASSFTAAMQQAQGELKKTADVAQSNADRMAQVGRTAFIGLGTAAVAFGAVAVKAFMDSQKVVAQTEAVLKSTGNAAGVTADQVGELASEIQNYSGISDEAVQAGENMLLTFCLEEAAEALTRDRGWVRHTDLRAGDEILTYDPEDDSIRWDPIDSMHRFQVEGDLIRWKSKQIDVATTPHHRWWTVGRSGRAPYEPQFRTTEQISGHQIYVKIGGGTPECFAGEPSWSDELVELAGWIVTEGWVNWVRPSQAHLNGCAFSQSLTANPEKVKQISGLVDRLRAQGHIISERDSVQSYNGSTIRSWYFARDLGATIKAMLPGKKLTPSLFARLTHRQAELLLETLLLGDGHRDRAGHAQYIQKDPGQLAMLAMLCGMLGVRTSVLGREDSIYLCQTNRLVGHQVNAKPEHYNGIVWCPHVRTGVFFARCNGRTFWTGNTNIRNGVGEGNDIFTQATRVLADMSTALGTDMSTQAIQLGKALNDPIRGITALTRVGVTFTAQQKEQIKTLVDSGNTMEAQKIILAELNKEFGGSAEALGNTFGGQLNILKNQLDDFMESVGGTLVPILSSLAGAAADVAGWFARNQEVVGALAGAIGGPLVAALAVYAARQAIAFSTSIINTIGGVTRAVFGLAAAEEVAAVGARQLGVAQVLATGGLSALGAIVGGIAMHFLGQHDAQKAADESAAKLDATIAGLSDQESGLGIVTDAATRRIQEQQQLFAQLDGDVGAVQGEILKLIGDQQSLDQASRAFNTTARQQQERLDAVGAATDKVNTAQDKLNKATEKYNLLQAGLGNRISRDQNSAHHNLEQAQLNHETAQTRLTEAVNEYGEGSVEARQASLDLESATFALTDAQEAMGHIGEQAWNDVEGAQQAVVDAQDDVDAAIKAQTKAQEDLASQTSENAKNTVAWQQAQTQLNLDWAAFEGMIAQHPEMRDQIANQVKTIRDNLPKGADTKPFNDLLDKINSMDPDKLTLAALANLSLQGWESHEGSNAPPPPGPLPAIIMSPTGMSPSTTDALRGRRASGGPVMPDSTYLVGEEGPELLHMGSVSGTVIPNGAAVGGITAVININGYDKDKRTLALEVRDEILRINRNNN